MIKLDRLNLLGETGGMSEDMDYIADAQRSARFKLHSDDREVAVIVRHDADTLLYRNRSCSAVGGGPDRFRGSLRDWRPFARGLPGRPGFLR
jgi:hypothetical protein